MLRHAIMLAAFTACATSALADPTLLSFEVEGAVTTVPRAINSAGDVTGTHAVFDFVPHGFVRFHDGTIQNFDAFSKGNWANTPSKINDRGEIAGTIDDTITVDRISRGFVRSASGKIKFFDVPGTLPIVITGLNNKGAVTGYRYDENTKITHAFERMPGGKVKLIEIPGVMWIYPGGITDKGVIAGAYSLTQSHGFLRRKDGTITTIDPPQDTYSSIVAINNAGGMAGYISNEGPFVRTSDGTISIFEVSGRKNIHIMGMNADGTVTGYWGRRRGRGFVRTPDGTVTTFEYGFGHHTVPEAINDGGVITGTYESYPDEYDRAGFLRIP
jgi:hypothetical protein